MISQHLIAGTVKQRVILLVLGGVELLDLAGPAQVFSMAASLGAPYSLHFCANTLGVRSAQGLFLGQLEPLPSVSVNDMVIVPGVALERLKQPLLDAGTRHWLIHAHTNGAQIASICTAAAVLGEAGLLDGRRCTTCISCGAVPHLPWPSPSKIGLEGI